MSGPAAQQLRRRLTYGISWLGLPFGAAAMIRFVAEFGRLNAAFDANADMVTPKLLVEAVVANGRQTMLFFNASAITTVAINWLTAGLPHHRELWQVWPTLLYVLSVGALAWATWIVAGRWAAVLLGAALATPTAYAVSWLSAQGGHGPAYSLVTALPALLVALVRFERRWVVTCLTVLGGGAIGSGLAADPYLAVIGLAPLLIVGGLPRGRDASERFLRARKRILATGATAIATWAAISALMRGFDVVTVFGRAGEGVAQLGTLSEIHQNVRLLPRMTLLMTNAQPSLDLAGMGWARVLLAGATIVSLALALGWAARELRRRTSEPPEVRVYRAFFASMVVCLCGAFVVSRAGAGTGEFSFRYVVPLLTATVAAGVTSAARSGGWRAVASVGVCLSSVLTFQSLSRHDVSRPLESLASERVRPALLAFLERESLTKGYGSYWMANAFTYAANGRAVIRSVSLCGRSLCPTPFGGLSGWYTPEPGRSFLVLDEGGAFTLNDLPSRAPAILGPPVHSTRIGTFRVYVYAEDIMSILLAIDAAESAHGARLRD